MTMRLLSVSSSLLTGSTLRNRYTFSFSAWTVLRARNTAFLSVLGLVQAALRVSTASFTGVAKAVAPAKIKSFLPREAAQAIAVFLISIRTFGHDLIGELTTTKLKI